MKFFKLPTAANVAPLPHAVAPSVHSDTRLKTAPNPLTRPLPARDRTRAPRSPEKPTLFVEMPLEDENRLSRVRPKVRESFPEAIQPTTLLGYHLAGFFEFSVADDSSPLAQRATCPLAKTHALSAKKTMLF